MRISRSLASAAVLAVVAASAIVISAPAGAATPGVTYVTAADVMPHATATHVGWGNIDHPDGSLVYFTQPYQGMYGDQHMQLTYGFAAPLDATTGSALRSLANGSFFTSASGGGVQYPRIPIDTGAGIQWIESFNSGTAPLTDLTALWRPTFAIGSIAANTDATLDQIDDQLALDPALAGARILGFGLHSDDGDWFYTMRVNGVDFSFLEQPVVTAAPTTVSQAAFGTTGATVTTTGFLGNESVAYRLTGPSGTGPQVVAGHADATGAFSFTLVAPTTTVAVGSYSLVLYGALSGAPQTFDFTVTASATATDALASTGIEPVVPFAIAGITVLGGLALIGTARRRRIASPSSSPASRQ